MSNVKAPISLWNGLCPITTNILCSKTICWSWTHCQTQIVLGCNDLIAPLLKNIHCTRWTKANAGGCAESQHVPSFVAMQANGFYAINKAFPWKRSSVHSLNCKQKGCHSSLSMLLCNGGAHVQSVTVCLSRFSLHRAPHLFLNGDWRRQGTPP